MKAPQQQSVTLLDRATGPYSLPVLALAASLLLGWFCATSPRLVSYACVVFAAFAMLLWLARNTAAGRTSPLNLLLAWALLVGVPVFVHFDPSGVTLPSLINAQSLARIALFVGVGYVYVLNSLARGSRALDSSVASGWAVGMLVAVFGWYALDSMLVLHGNDLLLATYRLGEWALLAGLWLSILRSLISRGPETLQRPLELINTAILLVIGLSVAAAVAYPNLGYPELGLGMRRLGFVFAHPNVLGVLAGLAVFYVLDFWRRGRAWAVIALVIVLGATYSRGAWIGFLLATLIWILLRAKTLSARILASLGTVVAFLMLAEAGGLQARLLSILGRSQGLAGIETLSQRTHVWAQAWRMIEQRPVLGYGYAAGPKLLNAAMASSSTGTYFRALHAHNEWLQAQLSGGLPATLFSVFLLARVAYLLYELRGHLEARAFRVIACWLVQLLVYGLLTPMLSAPVAIPGAIFLLLYLCLELTYAYAKGPAYRGLAAGGLEG